MGASVMDDEGSWCSHQATTKAAALRLRASSQQPPIGRGAATATSEPDRVDGMGTMIGLRRLPRLFPRELLLVGTRAVSIGDTEGTHGRDARRRGRQVGVVAFEKQQGARHVR